MPTGDANAQGSTNGTAAGDNATGAAANGTTSNGTQAGATGAGAQNTGANAAASTGGQTLLGEAAKAGANGAQNQDKTNGGQPAELEIKLPEGLDAKSEDATATVKAVRELAKISGLDAKQTQAVADAYFKATEAQRQSAAAMTAENKAWQDQVRADKEIGGAKLEQSLSVARGVLTKYPAGAEVAQLLEKSGLGNHPAFVKLFFQIGSSLSEDSIAGGTGNGAQAAQAPTNLKELAAKLYG